MWTFFLIILLLVILGWFRPLLHPTHPVLPVLLIGPLGNPPAAEKNKSRWISTTRLEKLFKLLQQKNFTPVFPSEIVSRKLPKNPVLLVFNNGYQSIYQQAFPLLQQYHFKAAVAIPVGLIGQYDVWETNSPWQNLLTNDQIKQLLACKQIEFISQGVDNTPLDSLSDEIAVWQLRESKFRFKKQYRRILRAFLFARNTPQHPALLTAAQKEYAFSIGHTPGNNRLPLSADPLHIFSLTAHTSLLRLSWKLRRF